MTDAVWIQVKPKGNNHFFPLLFEGGEVVFFCVCVYFQSYPEELSFIGTPARKEHEQDAKEDRRRIQGPVIIADDGFPPPAPSPPRPPWDTMSIDHDNKLTDFKDFPPPPSSGALSND